MNRALIPIYAITFIDILGFTILVPLLPYVAERYGASTSVVGLLVSTVAIVAAVSSPMWGALSDRIGRKTVLLASQVCTLAGYLLLAIPGSILTVILSRVVAGLGGGNLGVAQSYVADVTDPHERDQAYAFQSAAFGAGFVVGPLLSGLLVHYGFAVPFYAAAALEVVILALTIVALPHATPRLRKPATARDTLRAINTPALRNLLTRQFLYIFGFTYLFTILGLYVQRALGMGAAQTSVFLGVAGAVGAAAQLGLVHRLAKRFGLAAVAQIGLAIGALAYAALFAVSTATGFVLFLIVWAAGGGLVSPALAALLSETAPHDQRGLVLGFSDSLNNFALMLAPAIGASVIEFDLRATGVIPAVALFLAFGFGAVARRQSDAR